MPVITPPDARVGLQPQNVSAVCVTRRRRMARLAALYVLIIAGGVAAAVWAYHYFQPAVLTHPDFEAAAVSGAPQVDERYGYSTLQVDEEYSILLCGVPANDGQTVDFYLTNPEDNGVWFRAEVLNEGGDVIGSTGVLRQGEHLPSLTLTEPLSERETPVTLRIVAYEPNTWQSRGNVNLNLTLYLEFS